MFVASDAEIAVQSLEARVADLCGLLNSVTAELVSAIAQAMETGAWQGAGIRGPEHWVSWKCGLGPGRAGAMVRMARRLSELPVTKQAFDEGRLSEDQVKVICRHTPVHNDAEVATFATHATVSQLSRTLGSYPFQGERPEAEERREVSFGTREDGSWGLRAVLPPDQGMAVQKALEAARDAEFATRHPEGDGHVYDITWADALLRLAQQSRHPGHHRGHLDITGDPNQPDGLTFTDPKNGSVLDSCGRPRPPNRAPAEAAEALGVQPGRFVHPRGEPLERKWVAFSEPPG